MIKDKIYISRQKAVETVKMWQSEGHKIVFTNGCFDLLHLGHVTYLEDAKMQGDKLIVAVNSDAGVARLKGENRPIKDENSRLHILAALESTDLVILFDEDTPYQMIDILQPDVLVKGGDWPVDKIVGNDIVFAKGGKVLSLQFVEGYSTTSLEQKIIDSYLRSGKK